MKTPTANAWLQQLLGEWTYTFRTADDSDHPGATASGAETVRSISEHFVAVENTGRSDNDDQSSHSITLIGYEPDAERFTGAVAGTAVSAPASRSVTSTRRTTAACARSRRRKARTSV